MIALIGACIALMNATNATCAEPLRLEDGRPLVCVYFFGHWWDPWKSDDEAIRRDLSEIRESGVSVLALDHEWSQAIDGDWKWLDREHRLAREAGLRIIPWLSLKVWADLSAEPRRELIRDWYGVDLRLGTKQDGAPGSVQIWDEATIHAGAAYAAQYIDRYRDQALLHLRWKGQVRPVVALSVELAWDAGGFDDATNMLFIRWLRERYARVEDLNKAWGTAYATLWEVNPRDGEIFDYANHAAGTGAHPAAVEDHIEFRAGMISDALGMMAARLRRTHPDVVILAELPYQFASDHPHAEGYRIGYAANPTCTESADILFFRATGLLNAKEADFLKDWTERTGQPAILGYRTYSDWGNERAPEETARIADLYANQVAELGSGFAFYSWNEMVDCHVAPSPDDQQGKPFAISAETSSRAKALMSAMIRSYLHKLPEP